MTEMDQDILGVRNRRPLSVMQHAASIAAGIYPPLGGRLYSRWPGDSPPGRPCISVEGSGSCRPISLQDRPAGIAIGEGGSSRVSTSLVLGEGNVRVEEEGAWVPAFPLGSGIVVG